MNSKSFSNNPNRSPFPKKFCNPNLKTRNKKKNILLNWGHIWQEKVEITYINRFDVWFGWFLFCFGINTNFLCFRFFYNTNFCFRFFSSFFFHFKKSREVNEENKAKKERKKIKKSFVCENGNISGKNPIFEVVLAINTEIIKAIHDMKVQELDLFMNHVTHDHLIFRIFNLICNLNTSKKKFPPFLIFVT